MKSLLKMAKITESKYDNINAARRIKNKNAEYNENMKAKGRNQSEEIYS